MQNNFVVYTRNSAVSARLVNCQFESAEGFCSY